jgi:phenylacetate-CoA ligase
MKIWSKEEALSRDELTALQDRRLRDTVRHAYNNQAPYAAKMRGSGLEPGDIRGVADIAKLPVTMKGDLRQGYPFGMFAVPMEEIVRLHASSGTTGKQTVVGHTRGDLGIWTECMARCLTMTGLGRGDIIQISYGYGLFTGGLGGHYGSETIGAATVPASAGNTQRQIELIADFGVTGLLCTPSYAMVLGETVRGMGLRDRLKLRVGVFGAEPWTEGMRAEIESLLGLKAMEIFGLSEMCGPGVACDCEARQGMHVMEDHFYPEIIDPDTGAAMPDGAYGELVFSSLTRRALPLLRYRTRDITRIISREPCSCGRNFVRMDKLTGRSDDMLIIRGVNVFPSQIENALLSVAGTTPHYLLIVDRVNNLDTLEVQIEVQESNFSDEVRKMEALSKKIRAEIESAVGVGVTVRLTGPGSVQRFETGKAKRVLDKRTL